MSVCNDAKNPELQCIDYNAVVKGCIACSRLSVVVLPCFSLSLALFFTCPQLPRAWNRSELYIMNNRPLVWGLEAGLPFRFGVNNADDFLLRSQNKIFSFFFFQNVYSNYSQWYQQYGAAYGHPHQTATQ